MHHTRRITAWVTCLLGAVLLTIPLPHPSRLGWQPLLRDWCHAGVFALMAWMVMRLQVTGRRPLKRMVCQTLGLMLLMAAGSELIQSFTGRNMDVADFLQDVIGMGAGMAFALAPHVKSGAAKASLVTLGAGLLVFSARDLIFHAAVVWQKRAGFPLLEDFENVRTLQLWHLEHEGRPVDIQLLTDVPTQERRLYLDVHANGLTSLHGDALGQDWSGWSHLVFDAESSAPVDLQLGVRIDNALEPKKRLNLEAVLKPGANLASVPLPASPEARQVLQKTGQFVLFTLNPGHNAVLRLDNLRLERR